MEMRLLCELKKKSLLLLTLHHSCETTFNLLSTERRQKTFCTLESKINVMKQLKKMRGF